VPKINSKALLLFALFVALLVGSGLALYYTGLWGVLTDHERLVSFVREHDTENTTLIFVALQVAQVLVAPIPGEVTGFAGGVLFGPLRGVAYSTIGLSLGSWLAFTIARLLGRPLVERLVSRDIMNRYDYVMGHRGLLVAFLLFLLPGFPKDYLCYLLGLGHMRLWHFLAISTVGRLFGTVLITFAGAYFQARRYMELSVVVGLSLLLILFIMVYRKRIDDWLRRMHITHRHEEEMKKKRDAKRSRADS
jgi:uncharacterized membrane protein YdjX (TVP38/TMEM64 family)